MNTVPWKRINAFFCFALLLQIVAGFYTFNLFRRHVHDSEWVSHTHEVLEYCNLVLSNVKDAETGSRGYVLTGNENFLQPYHVAIDRNEKLNKILVGLIADNSQQLARFTDIQSVMQEKFVFMQKTIDTRTKEGMASSIALINTLEGKSYMDEIRTKFDEMEAVEDQLLFDRTKVSQETAVSNKSIIVIGFSVSIIIFINIYFQHTGQIKKKIRAQLKARERQEWFIRTLYNIGDGVITTDQNYVITYLNPVAEKLTGYSQAQVLGKPMEFVLNIVHEKTREKIVNPVYAAIATRKVVNLAKDTLLIRRDGSEIHIDDSCAPIIGENNQVLGSVLVFRDVTQDKIKTNQLADLNLHLEERVMEKSNELLQNQVKWRQTLDNLMEGVTILGQEWHYLYVNNKAVEYSRYTREELLGRTMMEKFPGIKQTGLFHVLNLCQEERTRRQFEYNFTYQDESKAWFEISVEPIEEGLFILSMDIAERKKIEEERKEYLESLEKMVFMTSHKVRQPVTQIMGAAELLKEKIKSQEQLQTLTSFMLSAIESLEVFTRELSDFIYDAKRRNKSPVVKPVV